MADIVGIRKANNQPIAARGLVTTTAGPDLCHTLPTGRTARIRKIMAYNNTGAGVTLIFGTQTNAVAPGWIPLLPTLLAINGLENVWLEEDLPPVEFVPDTSALAAGLTGNILVQASAVGVLIRLEIEEIGA